MEYCARCLYPANAKPTIIFDDEGICSGCRYHESRQKIVWEEREKILRDTLHKYKLKARDMGNRYDCLIPVGGGKDSHYQAYLMKVVYGMNPLLVTYNHAFNSRLGIRNLNNMVEQFGCDLIRLTANPHSVRKISRYMLKKVGDLTWHYHAGIRTFPFQIAVKYKIPLVILGEHGFAELTGLVALEDMVEHTRWSRQEHDMRGFEPHELINEESGITEHDIDPYIYPTDEQIEEVGVRGIYMSNFVDWNAKTQAEFLIENYNFGIYKSKRERTFVLYAKTDDHANDVHDYLKYLKFGYGRATDDTSIEIRHGRMTREEGVELVKEYDHVKPRTLKTYLDFLQISEEQFFEWIEPMRDLDIWEKDGNGQWVTKDSVINHVQNEHTEQARVPLVEEEARTFGEKNKHLYFHDKFWVKQDSLSDQDMRGFKPEDNFIVV